jgi:hypothetical protein
MLNKKMSKIGEMYQIKKKTQTQKKEIPLEMMDMMEHLKQLDEMLQKGVWKEEIHVWTNRKMKEVMQEMYVMFQSWETKNMTLRDWIQHVDVYFETIHIPYEKKQWCIQMILKHTENDLEGIVSYVCFKMLYEGME